MSNIATADGKKILSRKYAQAFINLYTDSISIDLFEKIKEMEIFLNSRKKAIYFLSIPNIKMETKQKVLNAIFEKFGVKKILEPLIKVLSEQKRLFLINDILRDIRFLYKERKNIITFNVSTSHEISDTDFKVIKHFLETQTNKNIICYHNIDKSLIAGLRLNSSNFLWEYSIRKQCETLRKNFN